MPCCAEVPADPGQDCGVVFCTIFDVFESVGIEGAGVQSGGAAFGELGMSEFQLALVVGETAGDFARHLVGPELLLDVGGMVQEAGVEVVARQHVFGAVDVDPAAGVGVGLFLLVFRRKIDVTGAS